MASETADRFDSASDGHHTHEVRRGRLFTLIVVAYVIVGAFIAANHHYFSNTHGWKGIASAVIAILLWPLVLAGVNLHIK